MNTPKVNNSIHPRVAGNRTVHQKSNTSRKKRRSTVENTIAAIEAHLSRHPLDGPSQEHLAKLRIQLGNTQ